MRPVPANNLILNGLVEGGDTGMPVVFINALGTDLRSWDAVISLLLRAPAVAGRPLVRYDKRGHGLSDCPPAPYTIADHTKDLAGLIDHLGFTQVVLVGISVGGMIAMTYAAAHPEKVASLVLCDTAVRIGTTDSWNERIDMLNTHGMAFLADPILQRWFATAFIGSQPETLQLCRNMLTRTPLAGYTGTCAAIRDADLHPLLPSLSMPALVLCGEQDVATPPEICRELAALLPDAKFTVIKNAGHLPCIEQPGRFTRALTDFLHNLEREGKL